MDLFCVLIVECMLSGDIAHVTVCFFVVCWVAPAKRIATPIKGAIQWYDGVDPLAVVAASLRPFITPLVRRVARLERRKCLARHVREQRLALVPYVPASPQTTHSPQIMSVSCMPPLIEERMFERGYLSAYHNLRWRRMFPEICDWPWDPATFVQREMRWLIYRISEMRYYLNYRDHWAKLAGHMGYCIGTNITQPGPVQMRLSTRDFYKCAQFIPRIFRAMAVRAYAHSKECGEIVAFHQLGHDHANARVGPIDALQWFRSCGEGMPEDHYDFCFRMYEYGREVAKRMGELSVAPISWQPIEVATSIPGLSVIIHTLLPSFSVPRYLPAIDAGMFERVYWRTMNTPEYWPLVRQFFHWPARAEEPTQYEMRGFCYMANELKTLFAYYQKIIAEAQTSRAHIGRRDPAKSLHKSDSHTIRRTINGNASIPMLVRIVVARNFVIARRKAEREAFYNAGREAGAAMERAAVGGNVDEALEKLLAPLVQMCEEQRRKCAAAFRRGVDEELSELFTDLLPVLQGYAARLGWGRYYARVIIENICAGARYGAEYRQEILSTLKSKDEADVVADIKKDGYDAFINNMRSEEIVSGLRWSFAQLKRFAIGCGKATGETYIFGEEFEERLEQACSAFLSAVKHCDESQLKRLEQAFIEECRRAHSSVIKNQVRILADSEAYLAFVRRMVPEETGLEYLLRGLPAEEADRLKREYATLVNDALEELWDSNGRSF